jgi:hypothetical protein
MLAAATNEIIRVMVAWIRRADARLASGAAGNAAIGVAAREQHRLEEARIMRDLRNLLPAESFTPRALQCEPHGAVR